MRKVILITLHSRFLSLVCSRCSRGGEHSRWEGESVHRVCRHSEVGVPQSRLHSQWQLHVPIVHHHHHHHLIARIVPLHPRGQLQRRGVAQPMEHPSHCGEGGSARSAPTPSTSADSAALQDPNRTSRSPRHHSSLPPAHNSDIQEMTHVSLHPPSRCCRCAGSLGCGADVSGTALLVEQQVPIRPPNCPVVEVPYDIAAVLLATAPVIEVHIRAYACLGGQEGFVGPRRMQGVHLIGEKAGVPVQ